MIDRKIVLALVVGLAAFSSYYVLPLDSGQKAAHDNVSVNSSVPDFSLAFDYNRANETLMIEFQESDFTVENTETLWVARNSSTFGGEDVVLRANGSEYNTNYLIGVNGALELPIRSGSKVNIVKDGADFDNNGEKGVDSLGGTDMFPKYYLIWNNGSGRYNRATALITYENGSWVAEKK